MFRSLTQRMAGEGDENLWKPVLAELGDGLVPAFIVEELVDGRVTVFVPSVPTPFAGGVQILSRERVHLVDILFAHRFPPRYEIPLLVFATQREDLGPKGRGRNSTRGRSNGPP